MPSPFPDLPHDRRGTVRRTLLRSRALEGNPWGDPTSRDLHVYTPPGYDDTNRHYPAVLALAPFSGTGEKLLARGLFDISLATRIDRLIDAGCPPFIAVLPDVMTSVIGSQYLDSPGIGAYGSYVADEVRGYVDAHFRTTGRWGAVGRSSGGFGALSLAMDRPGTFHAIGCHAGDLGFEVCYLSDLSKSVQGFSSLGGAEGFVDAFWRHPAPSSAAFAAMNILCMACAYDSRPGLPVGHRLPVDPSRGTVDFERFFSWSRHDPLVRVKDPSAAEALGRLRLLFLDAGDRDEYHLHLGLRRFVERLASLGIDHRHEEFPGGHRGTNHRLDVSLPLVARALHD